MARNVAWQVLRASKVTINSWNVRNRQKLIQESVCLKRFQGPGQEASAFQVVNTLLLGPIRPIMSLATHQVWYLPHCDAPVRGHLTNTNWCMLRDQAAEATSSPTCSRYHWSCFAEVAFKGNNCKTVTLSEAVRLKRHRCWCSPGFWIPKAEVPQSPGAPTWSSCSPVCWLHGCFASFVCSYTHVHMWVYWKGCFWKPVWIGLIFSKFFAIDCGRTIHSWK